MLVNIQIDKGSYKLKGIAQCYSFSNNNSSTLTALLNGSTLMQINGNGSVSNEIQCNEWAIEIPIFEFDDIIIPLISQ